MSDAEKGRPPFKVVVPGIASEKGFEDSADIVIPDFSEGQTHCMELMQKT